MSTRGWAHEMDTYSQLNLMLEDGTIKYATLRLNDISPKWWRHGMVTTTHDQINSYVEFIEQLIDPFERKYLKCSICIVSIFTN